MLGPIAPFPTSNGRSRLTAGRRRARSADSPIGGVARMSPSKSVKFKISLKDLEVTFEGDIQSAERMHGEIAGALNSLASAQKMLTAPPKPAPTTVVIDPAGGRRRSRRRRASGGN